MSDGPDRYDAQELKRRGTVLNPETPTRATGIVKNINEK